MLHSLYLVTIYLSLVSETLTCISIIIIQSLTQYETFAMKTNCWKEVERTLNSKEVLNVLINILCAYDKSDIFEKN